MSTKLKRAAMAAACAVGVTAGALGMATPAYASTASANYSCSYPNPSNPSGPPIVVAATTNWTYAGGELEIVSNIDAPQDLVAGQVKTTINGSTVENLFDIATGDDVILGPSAVTGSIAVPNPLILTINPPGVTVTCTLVSSSGFPLT